MSIREHNSMAHDASASPRPRRRLVRAAMLVCIVVAASSVGWVLAKGFFVWTKQIEHIQGVSYSPFRLGQSPFEEDYPSAEQIDSDMEILAGRFRRIRTYGTVGVMSHIVHSAAKHDLAVTAGAWLDKDLEKNEQELREIIRLADRYDNIEAAIVGNEVLLRDDLPVEQLADYLRQARAELDVPVSTAETWHIWLNNRELAEHADFIAVHILPYWEGVPVEHAVDYVFRRLREVQAAFPDKRIVLAEVGWPSGGQVFEGAVPSPANQEFFYRDFLRRRQTQELEYFAIEAFDQPWKVAEGPVGGHWGLFDVHRQPKIDFHQSSGVLLTAGWQLPWALSTGLAAALAMLLAVRMDAVRFRGLMFLSLAALVGLSLWFNVAMIPSHAALNRPTAFLWFPVLGAMALMLLIAVTNTVEMVQLLWRRRWSRMFGCSDVYKAGALSKVSVHVPVCNEPPGLVIQSLRALSKLDYPDFEVLVVSNNTPDESVWQPLQIECERLGERFRFHHLQTCAGAKAGALNFALSRTSDDAEIIAVLDSDYVVRPDWLLEMIPHFEKQTVAAVQAPQDYRGWQRSSFARMCNWEYQGFFRIGMVHRNEHNAIIHHGTMILIRRSALEGVGGWAKWCICEDAELGLRLARAGYESVYVPESFGQGVVPPSFRGYKLQRDRWAYGAARILRRHWRAITGLCRDALSPAQRYHYVAGWLPWLGNSLHLVFTFVMLAWTVGLVIWPSYFPIPYAPVVLPFLLVCLFNVARVFWVYSRRVPCGVADRLGAMLAGLSLIYTIGKAFLAGLVSSSRSFGRTPKSSSKFSALSATRQELVILVLLLAAIALTLNQDVWSGFDRVVWVLALAVQSLPFAASVALGAVSSVCQRRLGG